VFGDLNIGDLLKFYRLPNAKLDLSFYKNSIKETQTLFIEGVTKTTGDINVLRNSKVNNIYLYSIPLIYGDLSVFETMDLTLSKTVFAFYNTPLITGALSSLAGLNPPTSVFSLWNMPLVTGDISDLPDTLSLSTVQLWVENITGGADSFKN